MTSLHVICGLGPPPIKNPGYAYATYGGLVLKQTGYEIIAF